jgi:LacI family transcriptional regulator
MIAFGLLLAIREAGLRCPEDVSVIGFDNLDLAEMTNPSLSSVSQPGYQLGMTAAQILLDRVSGDTGPPKHYMLETVLVLRESVISPDKVRGVASNHGHRRSSSRK